MRKLADAARRRARTVMVLIACLVVALLIAGCAAASASPDLMHDEDLAPDDLAHVIWRPGYDKIINER